MRYPVAVLNAAVVLLVLVVTSCAGSSGTLADENEPIDIRWLTNRLQDEGVFVTERGVPNASIVARTSSRLLLDGREVLDVFEFTQSDRARAIAVEFAGRNPRNDVFLKESLVVVRYSRRDTGLNQVIYQLLGAAL